MAPIPAVRNALTVALLALCAIGSLSPKSAWATIDRLEILRTEPAFGGRAFGEAGVFERVIARAHGSLDPTHPANARLQDIGLAPRNAQGKVEYISEVEILRPTHRARANGVLLFNITRLGTPNPLSTARR